MRVEFTITELENLIMMGEAVERWYRHDYARSAVAKLRKARKEYLDEFRRQQELFEEDEDE